MAALGACPPAGTRLTGTLGTTATAARAAARGLTVQDPGEPQLSCQGLHLLGKLLKSGHLVCWTADHKSGPLSQQDEGQVQHSSHMVTDAQ